MRLSSVVVVLGAAGLCLAPAYGQVFNFTPIGGLHAQAEFTLINPTTLQIRLQNLSTSGPAWFDSSDHLVSTIAFDLGAVGENVGDAQIIGGSVAIGATSASTNFDTGSYGANADVSGEFGYGNGVQSGQLYNFVSANSSGATIFGGPNLDGMVGLNGPQPGLASAAYAIPEIGMIGYITDEVMITLTLNQAIADTSFLNNGVAVEWGSDATVPSPASAALLGLGGLAATRRRRH